METYDLAQTIKTLKEKGVVLFSLRDFSRLFGIKNQNTLYKKIQRLEKKGIIEKLIKGRYHFLLSKVDDFTLANFLYQPSYISFETALSFYGIITGFPYKINSATTKKPKFYLIAGKEFRYSKIKKSLFWGYEKKGSFLIAEKEKALLDYLYFYLKGLRSFDRLEFELQEIDRKKLAKYAQYFADERLSAIVKQKLL
jgi:predicted transcriptional regulator of viral defense system